jgi:predicted alpha/beta hydrolase
MQAASDIFLGWLTAEGPDGKQRDFYVRQLWDGKGSAQIELMDPQRMGLYGKLCGWTLARAHARSGDRVAIASYLGKGDSFERAMCDFATAYADQNEADYKEFESALSKGKLKAVTGV